ncbi:putative iron-sulfur cluster assembly associated protein Nar1 [Aulographum hederae CBS 113979]|uniref:Nuclear architecture-related protein 1 n=1 Tax=Aulographum hederae CBS 113979 TaxID=1176131 RepID=A0A6G1GJ41_9PEZI|nr:putative iron-sulfur cluster assembly associated protein Nar1 [Aulographum hederae CBS 113979]
MSAILSADDLNDFISPGVACIKPIETLPKQQPDDGANPYEVTTEDKVAAANPPPAQISLTDCLACSGCVTSAEAVLVSLQSHTEVLNTLDAHPSLDPALLVSQTNGTVNGTTDGNGHGNGQRSLPQDGKIFVASVSPQTRASLAATYGITSQEAGNQISQLLSGPQGLATGGRYGSSFTWVIDTNILRSAALVLAADEVTNSALSSSSTDAIKKPILTSACPGWICYAEKTHPHILPHLSRLKSPQALTGTLIKSVLARRYGISPDRVWHLAVMPCFDKKLEASRAELTSAAWLPDSPLDSFSANTPIRDVDCVITARELVNLANLRGISFPALPRTPLSSSCRIPFPDPKLDHFLFPDSQRHHRAALTPLETGPSGGYLWHILQTARSRHQGSRLLVSRGRNADVVEYKLIGEKEETLMRAARYYGFRNIQNLVRRLKPARKSKLPGARPVGSARKPGGGKEEPEYAYVEVMACPGGCTNGGGQIKVSDLKDVGARVAEEEQGEGKGIGAGEQRKWLERVDEAYFSAEDSSENEEENAEDAMEIDGAVHNGTNGANEANGDTMDIDPHPSSNGTTNGESDLTVDGISHAHIHDMLSCWAQITGVSLERLVETSFRAVESDVGKKMSDVERVAGLASTIGGGW